MPVTGESLRSSFEKAPPGQRVVLFLCTRQLLTSKVLEDLSIQSVSSKYRVALASFFCADSLPFLGRVACAPSAGTHLQIGGTAPVVLLQDAVCPTGQDTLQEPPSSFLAEQLDSADAPMQNTDAATATAAAAFKIDFILFSCHL
jgi:hypothetical protein